MSFNIIGDIAGRYDTLMALLKKMPEGEVISVGDMIDRGPKSREVLEFFQKNGRAVLGNHEHMFLEYAAPSGPVPFYDSFIWLRNGGRTTAEQYKNAAGEIEVPKETIEWLRSLPLYIELDGAVITHAPIYLKMSLKDAVDIGFGAGFTQAHIMHAMIAAGKPGKSSYESLIWNREPPRYKPLIGLQIFGHNSHKNVKWYSADGYGTFAVGIDTSYGNKLTGIHWPSGVIYEQEFLEKELD